MTRYLLGRLAQGVGVLLTLFTIVFILVKLMPGDPFTAEKALDEAVKEERREVMGLDEPILVQYVKYPLKALTGDFNHSVKKRRPVLHLIGEAFPVSLVLGVCALAFAILLGIPMAVISALKQNTWIDYLAMAVAMVGICVPVFVIGPLAQLGIARHVPGLNIAGWEGIGDILLPAFCLGLATAAYLARLTRGSMIEVLSSDYIRTARAKGLSGTRTVFRHALRAALIPAAAFIGPSFAALISGSIIVEGMFQVPGLGQHFITAITGRDEFVIIGLALFYGALVVLMNLASDLLVAWLNPRVRLGAES